MTPGFAPWQGNHQEPLGRLIPREAGDKLLPSLAVCHSTPRVSQYAYFIHTELSEEKKSLTLNEGIFLGLPCGFSDTTKQNQKPGVIGLPQEQQISQTLHLGPANSSGKKVLTPTV